MCSLRSSWGCGAMKNAIYFAVVYEFVTEYSGETRKVCLAVALQHRLCAVVGEVGDGLKCICDGINIMRCL